jgi:hypothetical protein
MKHINKLIIGSGISSFVYFKSNFKKFKIFSNDIKKVFKSNNFYEYDSIGGNSNIWGGYINFKRHKKFLKNKKYKNFFNQNLFKISKIFNDKSKLSNTYCFTDKNDEIFRLKKSYFENKLTIKKVKKINILKKNLQIITSDNKKFFSNKIVLCIGNLNLIKLMHESNWINSNDIISFDDGSCNYVLNIFTNSKLNYYIPMPLKFIIEKLLFNKSKSYKSTSDTFILQKFSNFATNYKLKCKNIMKMDKNKIRYFLSNHIANLKINNIPVRKFIKKKSKKIDVYCSGTVRTYLPGPVIQDLIFDILNNR